MSIGEMISLFDEIEQDCISTKELLYAMYNFEYLNQDKASLSLVECIKYLERNNEQNELHETDRPDVGC